MTINTAKRILIATVVFLFLPQLLLETPPLNAAPFTVYGPGNSSCGTWTAESMSAARNGRMSLIRTLHVGWVLGFVSGAGFGGVSSLRETDAAAIEKWIDNYCQQNPLDTMSIATSNLVVELSLRANR